MLLNATAKKGARAATIAVSLLRREQFWKAPNFYNLIGEFVNSACLPACRQLLSGNDD